MKILSIALGIALALGLVAGMTLPGLATSEVATAPTEDFPSNDEPLVSNRLLPHMLRGKVTSIDEGKTFFVIQSQEQELSISVNDDTQYFTATVPQKLAALAKHRPELRQQYGNSEQWQIKPQEKKRLEGPVSIKLRPIDGIPAEEKGTPRHWSEKLEWLRRFGKEATFDDITVGVKALVVTAPEEDNHLAKWVLIIKPITHQSFVGTVTDISSENKTITIAPDDGSEAITLSYNEKTRFILRGAPSLERGQSVRAVYNEELVAKVVSAPIEANELVD